MCAIVDANVASRFFSDPVDPELQPLWEWIVGGRGVLVAGGQLLDELFELGDARRLLRNWERAKLARFIPSDEVEAETTLVEGGCASNDAHVIALARLSGARRLCSDDRLLHRDFRNPDLISNPRGRIYQNRSHADLLTHDADAHSTHPPPTSAAGGVGGNSSRVPPRGTGQDRGRWLPRAIRPQRESPPRLAAQSDART